MTKQPIIPQTGTKWRLKRNRKGWKRGQIVTMVGFSESQEAGCFTDGVKTTVKPDGKHEFLNYEDIEEVKMPANSRSASKSPIAEAQINADKAWLADPTHLHES